MHQGEAAVAPRQDFRRGEPQHVSTECPGLGNTQNAAIVAHIRAVLEQVETAKDAIQRIGKIELLRGRLATGQVKGEPLAFDRFILIGEFGTQRAEFVVRQVR